MRPERQGDRRERGELMRNLRSHARACQRAINPARGYDRSMSKAKLPLPLFSRRQLLAQAGGGAGFLALAALLADEGLLGSRASAAESTSSAADPRLNPLAPKKG